MTPQMPRRPEEEYMDDPAEALAYAAADFSDVNAEFAARLLEIAGPSAEIAGPEAEIAGPEAEVAGPSAEVVGPSAEVAGPSAARVRALDLGTGPGEIPIRIVRARKDWHVTAVDAAGAMLDIARAAALEAGVSHAVEWVRADAKATGLPPGRFDVVFSNSILHHVSDPAAFWAEVKRLAAPGGVIFLRDLARPADEAAARRIVETYADEESQLLQEEFYRSLLAAYTVDEVAAQLEEAGLTGCDVAMVTDRHLDVVGRTAEDVGLAAGPG